MTARQDLLYRSARKTLAHVVPAPIRRARRVMVVGLPRSGTSWMAKALSLSAGVSYYFEPDHYWPDGTRYLYLPADEKHPELRTLVSKALAGKVRDEYAVAELDWRGLLERPFARTVLAKFVRLPLSIEWLSSTFPDATISQIIRHPAPLILSWRTRGWRPDRQLDRLMAQKRLMDTALQPYRFAMQSAHTYWEKAAAFWAATTVLQLLARKSGAVLVQHEWLCQAPEEHFTWLLSRLGLPHRPTLERFIRGELRSDAGPGYGRWREPASEIHKWEGQVTPDELRQIQRVVEQFELPVYRDMDPEDVLDPRHAPSTATTIGHQASLLSAPETGQRWRVSA